MRELLAGSPVQANGNIAAYALWTGIAAVGSVALYFASLACSHLVAFRVETNIRKESMAKVVAMPLGFFDTTTSGRIRKVIDDNAGVTHSFVAHQMPDLAGTVLVPVASIALIMFFNARLGLACLIPVAILLATGGESLAGVMLDMLLFILITPVFSQSIMRSMYIRQAVGQAAEAIDRLDSMLACRPLAGMQGRPQHKPARLASCRQWSHALGESCQTLQRRWAMACRYCKPWPTGLCHDECLATPVRRWADAPRPNAQTHRAPCLFLGTTCLRRRRSCR